MYQGRKSTSLAIAQSVDAHLRKLVRDGRVTTYLEDGATHYEIAE